MSKYILTLILSILLMLAPVVVYADGAPNLGNNGDIDSGSMPCHPTPADLEYVTTEKTCPGCADEAECQCCQHLAPAGVAAVTADSGINPPASNHIDRRLTGDPLPSRGDRLFRPPIQSC